ncbi:MAG: 3'-5' exonuclease [Candidatus Omnitrophica bacterium]|nr:3'-5' exonuclease [Candidatus Omnitrophota bacterium]
MRVAKPLIILDLETTGIWIEKDRIIEIAMIKLLPSGQKETYHKRVNPLMPIPKVVQELTGITDADVKDAPVFKTIAREVAAFIGEADIGGFNVDKFDVPLLEREFIEAGVVFAMAGRMVYDAQKVFHLNNKRDLSSAYTFYCGKPLEGAHSALADTAATLEVLESQVKSYGEGDDSIGVLSRFVYPERSDFYDSERKFRWWNGELYMMFGKYARKESLREVARKDPGYLEWMLGKDFSEEAKALVQGVLKGQFPKFESQLGEKP